MRSDWCNDHAKEIIENCNLGKSAAYELEQAVKFRKEHSGFPELSNTALIPLARIKDPEKQAQAIEAVSQVTGPLTKKQVQAVIATIIPPKAGHPVGMMINTETEQAKTELPKGATANKFQAWPEHRP